MPPVKRSPAPLLSMRPYMAEGTLLAFFNDMQHWGLAIKGPRSSGKTTCIANRLLATICTARILPGTNIRSSRGAFVRNTFNRLWTTTVKEWLTWVPEPITTIRQGNPPTLFVRFYNPADNTVVQCDIMVVPADDADASDQFRGAQLTWAWINEASEIKKRIVLDQLEPSIGRWPMKQDGGPVWRGVLMDTNAMSLDHWWYELGEVIKPPKWKFYSQPPAVLRVPGSNPVQYVPNMGQQAGIPAAENIRWLDGGYNFYMNLISGKSPEWIRVFLMNEYGTLFSGKPVYWEYDENRHSAETLEVYGGLPIIMGVDFAVTMVAVFCQLDMMGQFRVIREVIEEHSNSRQFARGILSAVIHNEFGGMQIIGVGDPAGEDGNKTNEFTDFTEFDQAGIPLIPAKTNVIRHRLNAVRYYLQQHNGFKVSRSKCPMVCAAFNGDYHFQEEGIIESGDPKPCKDHPASDLMDCIAEAALEARGVTASATFRVEGKIDSHPTSQAKPVIVRRIGVD